MMHNNRLLARQKQQSGQAILEYVLLLVIILGMGGIIVKGGVQVARDKLWKQILCDVSRACPKCKAPDSINKALPNAKKKCN